MVNYALGTIDPLPVKEYDGFIPDDFVTRLKPIDRGDGAVGVEVLQTGSIPKREAELSSPLQDIAIADQLKAYFEASTVVTFTDPFGVSVDVIIVALRLRTTWPDPYVGSYTMTIVDAAVA
jgi:hypothetical protein